MALYEFVCQRRAALSGKTLVTASLMALTDPFVTDINIRNVIYALAVKQRFETDPSSGCENGIPDRGRRG